jgi:hypothetical protein
MVKKSPMQNSGNGSDTGSRDRTGPVLLNC